MGRILVVDDDKDILKFTTAVLSSADHVVATAEEALGAIELLNTGYFDLLLADANLPYCSGFDLVRTLRKISVLNNSLSLCCPVEEKKEILKKEFKRGLTTISSSRLMYSFLVKKWKIYLTAERPLKCRSCIFRQIASSNKPRS
ncbi:MAG: response regulator [Bdellovibrionales bacterium]|nr:response regulator [Bdellovibrionales bacterium]